MSGRPAPAPGMAARSRATAAPGLATAAPSLAVAIRRHAAARPFAVAIHDAEGEHTFAALDRAVDVAAAGIQASGISPGDRVALVARPSAEAIAILAGILRAGAIAVPLGTRLTNPEIAAALGETAPGLIVHDADLAVVADGRGSTALAPDALAARGHGAGRRSVDPDPASPAVAVMTSGTTGRPRAALLSHAALAASAAAWTQALPPASGWLLCLGLAHVAGLGVAWRALGAGVPLTVVQAFDAGEVLAALARPVGPSHVSLVPVQLARVLDAAGDAPPAAALRAVLLGGAPVPPGLVARANAAGWPVVPTYGLTEAASGVTAVSLGNGAPDAEEARLDAELASIGSAGRPLPGVAVRIAEPGADGVGEIEVLSPAAFSGYLGRPDETAASFTADGWLRTGDLGRLDAAARLFVVDRRDDLLVAGGENVYPAQVEDVLATHPAIADAGVVGRPDAGWGAVPVAAIVLRAGATDPGDAAIRAWCRERLAPYKIPTAFARLGELPRTTSGKLRRKVLRDRLVPFVVLLHATLSTGRRLAPLADILRSGGLRVAAPDRLGSGTRRLDPPRPVAMDEHVADVARLLDAEGVEQAVLVGHSYGGVVAIEVAAALPERISAVVAYEPPYGPVADPATGRAFAALARKVAAAASSGGTAAAAAAFMRGISSPGAWEAVAARTRAALEVEGGGAIADAGLVGVDPAGLGRIVSPVTLLTGSASESFYGPIAVALAARIPGARMVVLPGLRHSAPVTDPEPVAAAVREALAVSGVPIGVTGGAGA